MSGTGNLFEIFGQLGKTEALQAGSVGVQWRASPGMGARLRYGVSPEGPVEARDEAWVPLNSCLLSLAGSLLQEVTPNLKMDSTLKEGYLQTSPLN